MTVIDDFRGEYAFLSNFYSSPVWMLSRRYRTVEHAYQAAKTLDLEQREIIREAATPAQAKRLGRKVIVRSGWDSVKLRVMLYLLRRKFAKGTEMADALEGTGDAKLVEGNWWGDTFWGVCGGVGENHLGKLLMQIREENRA
jgi:ribA/ribD-fused uncharacterized protein